MVRVQPQGRYLEQLLYMQGKIIKGIAGFYYVHDGVNRIFECKAKGVFRSKGVTPLVGDNVELEVISVEPAIGNIVRVLPRESELIRPAVANVDQALVVFAAKDPEPNLNLLDRFLVMMKMNNIPVIICFNKQDIVESAEIEHLCEIYKNCGHQVLTASVRNDEGVAEIRKLLAGKTTVLAGPSGVGKSSMMNRLQPEANMETGELSEKIRRGKQTTRHTELVCIEENTFLCDTPGFSSLFVPDIEKEKLKDFFPEFVEYEPECRFLGCNHIKEPECGIKSAVRAGLISKVRYENYCQMFEEISLKKRYK